MSTLEEIKAATAKLKPEEQEELFKWWTSSESFKARQLGALKRELALGKEQLKRGQYQTYDDGNLMRLAEQVGEVGRERLKKTRKNPPT